MGKRIPTVYYSSTKEIGTYTGNRLALVYFKVMPTNWQRLKTKTVCFVYMKTAARSQALLNCQCWHASENVNPMFLLQKVRDNITRFHHLNLRWISTVLVQEPDVAFINMVELVASVDVDPAHVVNWTTRRKYVISRPRIYRAKQSRHNSLSIRVNKLMISPYSSTTISWGCGYSQRRADWK